MNLDPNILLKYKKAAEIMASTIDPVLLPLLFMNHQTIKEVINQDPYAGAMSNRSETVLLACYPRSGSTFTFQVLMEVLGYRRATFTYARKRSEHDLYIPMLLSNLNANTISQQHILATDANLGLLEVFDIKCVILVRNIFDALISLFRAYKDKGKHAFIFGGYCEDWSDELLMDYLIEFRLPWYLHFYISWSYAIENGQLSQTLVCYEDMVFNEVVYFENILTSLGSSKSNIAIQNAIQKVRDGGAHRLSKDKDWRQEEVLSKKQKEKIVSVTSLYKKCYEWLDFTKIGIY